MKAYDEQMNKSMYFLLSWHQLERRGQLQVPAAFPLGEEHLVPIE
jgi:hypothetical protein